MEQTAPVRYKQTWIASLFTALLRPHDATGITIKETGVEVTRPAGPETIPFGEVRSIATAPWAPWGEIRIGTTQSEVVVSGLRKVDATAAETAVAEKRAAWWQNYLAEHAETVKTLTERLASLDGPTRKTRAESFAGFITEVRTAARNLPKGWPREIDPEPIATGIRRIRAMLARPETGRQRANRILEITRVDRLLDALRAPTSYVRRSTFGKLLERANRAPKSVQQWYEGQKEPEITTQARARIRELLKDPEGTRNRANEAFLRGEKARASEHLDNIGALPLSEEQLHAVCVDDDRNLVVAAAGSGKTRLITAKADWIIERGDRKPNEVLLLAFARDARNELKQRVDKRLRDQHAIRVETFHSLGLKVIAESEGRNPTLGKAADSSGALNDLLAKIVDELKEHPEHGRAVLAWLAYHAAPYRPAEEFESLDEYRAYIRRHELQTLQGERVKSFEEYIIAEYLYLNGVCYEYERPYEHNTASKTRRQYQPDFYLPDARIYIEHFALRKDGTTPAFINQTEYQRSRAWKQALHRKHRTTLIETFSYENQDGRLRERLGEKLRGHGVALRPIPRNTVFAALKKRGRVTPLIELAGTFLRHFKGSAVPVRTIEERAERTPDGGRSLAFMAAFRPIFERYNETLANANEIDFEDMINRATNHVAAGQYPERFGYILVDEFQDISANRGALLKALLRQTPNSQLFAVGDDWQAIYRFAGSDIGIMRQFEEHFGAGARSDLERTFRCPKELSDVARDFVLRNQAQLVKRVRSQKELQGAGVRIIRGWDGSATALRKALDRITDDAAERPGATVLVLGRYRRTLEVQGKPQGVYRGLRLRYRTVHGAKGLEADYVLVLGLCSGRYGFPSEMTDDPVLNLVLTESERYPNAEERRLFYVALTRAKQRCYIAENNPRSGFVQELLQQRGWVEEQGPL